MINTTIEIKKYIDGYLADNEITYSIEDSGGAFIQFYGQLGYTDSFVYAIVKCVKKTHELYPSLVLRTKEYRTGKPITSYALSKYTGASITTVKRHPEILELLQKKNFPEFALKTAYVDTDRIHTLEQAKSVIKQITELYNETKNKYNDAIKVNSSLNLDILKLKDEVTELQRVLKTRENDDIEDTI